MCWYPSDNMLDNSLMYRHCWMVPWRTLNTHGTFPFRKISPYSGKYLFWIFKNKQTTKQQQQRHFLHFEKQPKVFLLWQCFENHLICVAKTQRSCFISEISYKCQCSPLICCHKHSGMFRCGFSNSLSYLSFTLDCFYLIFYMIKCVRHLFSPQ